MNENDLVKGRLGKYWRYREKMERAHLGKPRFDYLLCHLLPVWKLESNCLSVNGIINGFPCSSVMSFKSNEYKAFITVPGHIIGTQLYVSSYM